MITDYGKDVIQLEQRMAELAAADAARTKKHHERHAAPQSIEEIKADWKLPRKAVSVKHTELPDRIPA